MKNRLILAAAGSGKTQYIINEAIKITDAKVLITTYTISNTDEIKKRLIRTCGGSIPGNIVVQTWFSFLLQHGIKPFSPSLFETHTLTEYSFQSVDSRSSIRKLNQRVIISTIAETLTLKKHLSSSRTSTKLAKERSSTE